ncbi:hypothetical protein TNCV_3762971 [Trichonephila clavipes]|uniref:Uncharacterized protein n=1 Tax=Trichonephila clavipes TaxID=2585209 RepID=A0A8X7B9S2_TRICX|nr:hypothetical protein TNCV_3762971 [Trichonephila clavipes]
MMAKTRTNDRRASSPLPRGISWALFRLRQTEIYPHSDEFGTIIEDEADTNINSEKELSLELKLELVITKKNQQTKIQYRKQLYPKPSDEKLINLEMRDLEVNAWKKYIAHC